MPGAVHWDAGKVCEKRFAKLPLPGLGPAMGYTSASAFRAPDVTSASARVGDKTPPRLCPVNTNLVNDEAGMSDKNSWRVRPAEAASDEGSVSTVCTMVAVPVSIQKNLSFN